MDILLGLLLLLSLFQSSVANKDDLPVFLMDSENVLTSLDFQPNPFARMSSAKFTDIIHDAVKRSECVIIFTEEKLCSEDISTKDKLGTPYRRLHQGLLDKKVKYLPAVASPYKMLTQAFRPQHFNVFYLSSAVKFKPLDSSKYLYIYFHDGANETRSDSLRNHDIIMQQVYHTVRQQKPGPIVGFYTGKMNPIVVDKLQFVPIKPKDVPKDLGIMLITKGALFRFSGVFTASPLRRAAYNQMPMVAEETWSRQKLATTMAYTDFELQFNFSFEEDQWLLDNVALFEDGEEVGRTEMGVGAPWNWSYVCGEPLAIINTRDDSAVTISQYQIQPIHPKILRQQDEEGGGGGGDEGGEGGERGSDPSKCFGKTVNCGPYFNTHILSALFVVFICLAVLMYGILMLYNCTSNDKFDDPHGKEVIFSADPQ